jgi:hypothetical protein
MAITLKRITLWRKEVDNKPGALADTLALLAQTRTDLQAVMGYRYPGDQGAKRQSSCIRCQARRLSRLPISGIGCFIDPDRARAERQQTGLSHVIAKALGDAGINLSFVLAQVVGRKHAAVFGFENDSNEGDRPH